MQQLSGGHQKTCGMGTTALSTGTAIRGMARGNLPELRRTLRLAGKRQSPLRPGLVPAWAANKPKFGLKTYNARSETVAEKPSYRNAWKRKQFGLALMQGFYEPNYDTGKAVRWRIKRVDGHPLAVASIWERFIDHSTGEIRFSFSMLTINATLHPMMKQFHAPEDEKRSIVALQDGEYQPWLASNHDQALALLKLAPRPQKTGSKD